MTKLKLFPVELTRTDRGVPNCGLMQCNKERLRIVASDAGKRRSSVLLSRRRPAERLPKRMAALR